MEMTNYYSDKLLFYLITLYDFHIFPNEFNNIFYFNLES